MWGRSTFNSSYAPAWPFTHKHALGLFGATSPGHPCWSSRVCSCWSLAWWVPWSGDLHGPRQQLCSSSRRSHFSGRKVLGAIPIQRESHYKLCIFLRHTPHEDKMFFFTGRQECLRPLSCTEPKAAVCKACLQIYVIQHVLAIASDVSVLLHCHLKFMSTFFFSFSPANKIKMLESLSEKIKYVSLAWGRTRWNIQSWTPNLSPKSPTVQRAAY